MRKRGFLLALTVFSASTLISLNGFRQYAPLTEGWWHVYARWIADGKMPYRDFELLVPPGYPLTLRLLTDLFGESFLVLRILGAVQIGLIATCVYSLIQSICGAFTAVPLAVLSTSLLSFGTAFLSYDYVYTGLLFMLAAFATISRWHSSSPRSSIQTYRVNVLIGFCVGMCLSIKQSQGLWALVGSILSLVILRWDEGIKLLRHVAQVCLGSATVWIPMLIWLSLNGVSLGQLIESTVLANGPKGDLAEIFLGWIRDVLIYEGNSSIRSAAAALLLIIQGLLPLLLVGFVLRQGSAARSLQTDCFVRSLVNTFLLIAIICVSIGVFVVPNSETLEFLTDELYSNAPTGSLVATLFVFVYALLSTTQQRRQLIVTVCVAAISVVWAGAMSAGVSEIGYFVAVVVALSGLIIASRSHLFAVLLVGILSVTAISGGLVRKDSSPFSWWGYSVPSRSEAISIFDRGLMRGLRSSETVTLMYSKVQEVLTAAQVCPGEAVAFPHVPIFLLDANSLPKGRLAQYWYDFSTSEAIIEELNRLKGSKIKAIIIMQLPNEVREKHEELFNDGQPLSHRLLAGFLERKTETLILAVSQQISSDVRVDVWIDECTRSENERRLRERSMSPFAYDEMRSP